MGFVSGNWAGDKLIGIPGGDQVKLCAWCHSEWNPVIPVVRKCMGSRHKAE